MLPVVAIKNAFVQVINVLSHAGFEAWPRSHFIEGTYSGWSSRVSRVELVTGLADHEHPLSGSHSAQGHTSLFLSDFDINLI